MKIIDRLIQSAKENPGRVVLPEGSEPRILHAARRLLDEGIAKPVLLGDHDKIETEAKRINVSLAGIDVRDTRATADPELMDLLELYRAERPGTRIEVARRLLRKPLFFGGMMVKKGDAEAMIAGTAHPTARVIEAGLMTVGAEEGINTPSSFFLIVLPEFNGEKDKPLVYADCGVVIEPDASQLSDIAIASSRSASLLLDETPRVAFLSFSTKGSAQHSRIEIVKDALQMTRERVPDLLADGEFQVDSALVPRVAATKVKEPSDVAGKANVLIFPDLNSGNIAYKLTQYLAGAAAIGPILQGFSRPVCDLSRGASVDDIIAAAAIGIAQARERRTV
ncbi:MAG: phosphotransacetylase [Proteobacteria bacterium]|nr:MAG: phosphotransacetylase [Pseudomonadota bacterium]